jgi:hypothetical protein
MKNAYRILDGKSPGKHPISILRETKECHSMDLKEM